MDNPASSKPNSSRSLQPSLSMGQHNEPPSSSLPLTPNDLPTTIHASKPIPSSHPPSSPTQSELPSLQETFRALPIDSSHQSEADASPKPQQHPVSIKQSKVARRIVDSEDEDTPQDPCEQPKEKKRKSKKLKGLTKKEKEEAERVIAACERGKNVRLAASCRAPLTRLGDIINKATRAIETSTTDTHPIPLNSHPSDNTLPIKSASNAAKEPLKTKQNQHLSDDDDNDDELPNMDELMTTSKAGPSSRPRKNSKTLDPEEALKKKEWLKNQRKTVLKQGSSTIQDELVEPIDSDSDLDIIQEPNRATSSKQHRPKVSTDLFSQRLNRRHSKSTPSQAIQPTKKSVLESIPVSLFSTSLKSVKKTNGKKSNKPKENDLMQGLLAKSAIEGALIREQKRNEFIERGGRLAKEIQNSTSSSGLQCTDLKSILKNKQNAEEEEEEEEDIECDWDEMELSGEEEVDQAEGNDDEIEDSQEEQVDEEEEDLDDVNNTTIRPSEGEKRSKTESSSNSIARPSHPAHQLDYNSTILAPDSNSTDQNSPRTSSKPPVSDSSESDQQPIMLPKLQPCSSSPIDLPGFNIDQNSKPVIHYHSAHAPLSSPSASNDSNSLPGFKKSAGEAKGKGLSNSMVDGFSQIEGFTQVEGFSVQSRSRKGDNNSKIHQSTFSQFFQEDESTESHFTHPPPLLKSKAQMQQDSDDLDNEISATCILPAVEVLPEERERDLVLMVLGEQKTAMEDDDQPIEYVNHRGFLTQHKPVNGPPDSPLMSQDPIARTPFALRKGKSRVESYPARQIDNNEEISPTKARFNGQQKSMDCDMHSSTPPKAELDKPPVENAFTKIMKAQKIASPNSPPVREVPSGKGKMFLADEADESEDEYKGMGRGLSGDENESGKEEEDQQVLNDLVNDVDDQDEESKLKADLARRNLAKEHEDLLDKKQTDQIHKIINGKFRIQKARGNRAAGGAISDSDSEDDAEMIANKRALAFDAKKKKKAIDLIANKHEPFFKSYQEGTNWVDEDESTYLQPPEDNQEVDSDEEEYEEEDQEDQEEEEDALDEMVDIGGEPKHHHHKGKKKKTAFSSSPPITLDHLPLKIVNHHPKNSNLFNQSRSSTSNLHLDLDTMYDGLKSAKDVLSERQRKLVMTEFGGENKTMEEGNNRKGNLNNNKSSSVTFQRKPQRPQSKSEPVQKDLLGGVVTSNRPLPQPGNKLSKLKNKKK